MTQRKISYIVLSLIIASVSISAQELTADKNSRKERRIAKVEERRKSRENKKFRGAQALADKDFVLKAKEIVVTSRNTAASDQNRVLVASKFNFFKVEGEEVTIQFGAAERVARANGGGARVYKGKVETLTIKDKGEGKSFSAVIDFTSTYSNNVLSVHLVIWGNKAQARFYDGQTEVLLEGEHARLSETKLWNSAARLRAYNK